MDKKKNQKYKGEKKMKIIGVIPARYGSTRFQGKPLADIFGKPMIWWVYQNALKIKSLDEVYVATEDTKIINECDKYNIKSILTSDKHLSGTDRVGEISKKIDADIYLVLMGDEPLINPNDVDKLLEFMVKDDSVEAGLLTTPFTNPVDAVNTTTIKLAINDFNDLIFMSRSPIPFPKESLDYKFYKNVGAYAFTKETLKFFINTKPSNLELAEGLELLRLLENRKKVKVVKTDNFSISVDTYKDLERVKNIISSQIKK